MEPTVVFEKGPRFSQTYAHAENFKLNRVM